MIWAQPLRSRTTINNIRVVIIIIIKRASLLTAKAPFKVHIHISGLVIKRLVREKAQRPSPNRRKLDEQTATKYSILPYLTLCRKPVPLGWHDETQPFTNTAPDKNKKKISSALPLAKSRYHFLGPAAQLPVAQENPLH